MRADDLAEIVTPLEDAVVLFDPIAGVVAAEPRVGEVRPHTKEIGGKDFRICETQRAALQDRVLRMAHDDVVRKAETEIVHRARREDMRDGSRSNVRRPRTAAGHNPERAALKSIQDFPFVVRPAVVHLRLGRQDVVEAHQQLPRVGPAHADGRIVTARPHEIWRRQGRQQPWAVVREARAGNDPIREWLAVERIDGRRQSRIPEVPGALLLRGNHVQPRRPGMAIFPFLADEEKQLVLIRVPLLLNEHGTAQRVPEIVEAQRIHRPREEGAGIEAVVTDKFEQRSMELLRAALCDDVNQRA